MRVQNGTWVLVADGAKSLTLVNEGDADIINLRRIDVREEHHARTRELGASAPGSVHESMGDRRSSYEPADLHTAAETAFIRRIAATLSADHRSDRFRKLVLIAPPRAMAIFRAALNADLSGVVVAQITKDLTHHTIPEIENALREWDGANPD